MYLLLLLVSIVAAAMFLTVRRNLQQLKLQAHLLQCCADVQENISLVNQYLIPETHQVELELLRLSRQLITDAELSLHSDYFDQRQLELQISQADLLVHQAREHGTRMKLEQQAMLIIASAQRVGCSASDRNLATAKRALAEGDYRCAIWHAEQAERAGRSAVRHQAHATIKSLEEYLRQQLPDS